MQVFADARGMGKKRRHSKPADSIKDSDVKGRLPKGATYHALKGMGYMPSDRDENRKARKQARQDLRKGDW